MDYDRDLPPVVSTLRRGPEVIRLVEAFARALPGLCAALQASAVCEDLAAAAAAAHRLKGSAGGYGFALVHDLAAAVERAANDRDGTLCCDLARRLVEVGSRVRAGAVDQGWDQP